MGINTVQDASEPVGSAGVVDDQSGARVQHMAANARNLTTLIFRITKTSPGTLVGLGGDTSLQIPGGAVPVRLRQYSVLADANSASTITLGIDNVTSNHFLNGHNVGQSATGSGQVTPATVSNLHTALPAMALGQAHVLVGRLNVPVTSTGGGPWYYELEYYLPDPA